MSPFIPSPTSKVIIETDGNQANTRVFLFEEGVWTQIPYLQHVSFDADVKHGVHFNATLLSFADMGTPLSPALEDMEKKIDATRIRLQAAGFEVG